MTPDPTLIEQARPRCKMPDCGEPVYRLGVCLHHWEWLNGRESAPTIKGSAALPSNDTDVESAPGALNETASSYNPSALPSEAQIDDVIAAVLANTRVGNRAADDSPALRCDVTSAKAAVRTAMRATTPTAPDQDTGALSGSHASTGPCGLGPPGFDPARVEAAARALAPFMVRGLEDCSAAWDYPLLPAKERARILRAAEAVLVSALPTLSADGFADKIIAAANVAGPTLHLEQHDAIRLAIATEAGTATTTKIGVVHEGADLKGIAHD